MDSGKVVLKRQLTNANLNCGAENLSSGYVNNAFLNLEVRLNVHWVFV